MPKMDLYNALQIKSSAGEVFQLKGQGYFWSKPTALTPFYRSGTIGIHLRSNGATPPGGPVTAIANEGGAGSLFNASVVGTPVPLNGNYLEATASGGYPRTANPAELLGVRLMWVMRMNNATVGASRFFGMSESGQFNTSLGIIQSGATFRVQSSESASFIDFRPLTPSALPRMFELELHPTASRLWINGVEQARVSNPTFTALRINRMMQGSSALQAFEGGMGDVLGVVTGRPDTASAITTVRSYLTQRFGL